MKSKVPLANSDQFALVDSADLANVRRYSWRLDPHGYAVRSFRQDGKKITEHLHVFLIGSVPGKEVDHKDRVKLNCQRDNLRHGTRSQNMANRPKKSGTSKFKGVSWYKSRSAWVAQIHIKGVKTRLGLFSVEEEAARCYDRAAKEQFGEFAVLNLP